MASERKETTARFVLGPQHQAAAPAQLSTSNYLVGLAISGGVDSMALARLCHDSINLIASPMAPLFRLSGYPRLEQTSFTAFIVNHNLREGSAEEARNVAAELAKLNINAEILELDWREHTDRDPRHLPNLESVARRLRYRALGAACARNGIRSLLVAHHADDQAETVMSRIVSEHMGTGLRGIRFRAPIPECQDMYGILECGLPVRIEGRGGEITIPQRCESSSDGGGVEIVRPLLPFGKQQLIDICRQSGTRWFEDRTNADRTLTLRNTVRFLLNNDEALPKALRKDRLLKLAANIERKDGTALAEKMFNIMSTKLDLCAGRARVTLPPLSNTVPMDVQSRAALLRMIVDLVSPKETISLQDLAPFTDAVFAAPRDDFQDPRPVQEWFQVAKASFSHPVANGDGSSTLTIQRANPTQAERERRTLLLQSIERSAEPQSSQWHLWDNRYWIKVVPPAGARTRAKISVRFFSSEDVAAMRMSLDEQAVGALETSLKSVKGRVRFMIPAIVSTDQLGRGDGDSATERVVALPSLDWSGDGWTRAGESADTISCWQYDIKYKDVRRPSDERQQPMG